MVSDEPRSSLADLPTVPPPAELFRIHREQAGGLDLPPWEFARSVAPDGGFNFGGRWDDPNPVEGERFRTLSLGNDRIGVALEVFQSLRPDPTLQSLEATLRDPLDTDRSARPTINVSDLTSRRMSVVALDPDSRFLDVTHSRVRSYLEEQLAPMLDEQGIGTLKIGDLLGRDTQLSQRVAELVRDQLPDIAGLVTPSALGTDFTNFHVFEAEPESGQLRANGQILESKILSSKDPEVRIALDELRLDVALDADPTLTISPQPVLFRAPNGPPAAAQVAPREDLPVYRPGANEIVDRREDGVANEQSVRVLGRSEEGDRIFGRAGGTVLSLSRDAFGPTPKVDDTIIVRNVDGRDRAEPVERDVALER